MAAEGEEMGKGFVEGLIEALSDKHGQLDVRFQNLSVSMGGTGLSVNLSGSIQVAVHMRDLADTEKDAHVRSNIAAMRA
jgi:hypothetical protein